MQSGVALGRQRFRFRVDSALAGLALVIAAAAALRFGTLATQSYWYDESLTVGLTKTAFGLKALGVGVHGEAEPPLYFGLAWLWARPFGHGEAGLRSLSAACGVLTVPVVYSAAKTLFNVRTAVVAGLPAGAIWLLLRVEALRGGRGDRFIPNTPAWVAALPFVGAATAVGSSF